MSSDALNREQFEDRNIFPRPRAPLESVPRTEEYISEFPKTLEGLEPDQVHQYDLHSLELLGSKGVQGAFDVLDNWVRFPVRTGKAYATAIAEEGDYLPSERTLRVNEAARYIAKLRLRSILDSDSLPYSKAHYRQFPLFRQYSSLAERRPNETMPYNQLQTARISITAVKIFRSIYDPQPRTEERQAAIDDFARSKQA